MDSGTLKTIVDKHSKWLRGEEGGEKANLRSADLRSANLRSADLRSADLRYANLRSADLSGANLRSADLRSADLSSADLSGADLRYADLSSADLSGADLRSADLRYADLRSANLRSADLSGAKAGETTISKAMQFSCIDGSGRLITVMLLADGSEIIHAGCFRGPLSEFVAKAKDENKPYYCAVIPAAIEAARKVLESEANHE